MTNGSDGIGLSRLGSDGFWNNDVINVLGACYVDLPIGIIADSGGGMLIVQDLIDAVNLNVMGIGND